MYKTINEDYFIETLAEMKEWANSIASEWDGDFPGQQEDRAHLAEDILKQISNLRAYIELMKET